MPISNCGTFIDCFYPNNSNTIAMKKVLISVLLLFWPITAFSQGKLSRAKGDLSGKNSSSNYSVSNDDTSTESGDMGFLDGVVLELLYFATYGALIGELQPRTFHGYPYSDGQHGEYAYPESEHDFRGSLLVISNTVSIQSSTFANDLNVNYRFVPAVGVKVNHLHFLDRYNENEQLGLTSMMLDFYRIREKNVTGYWGVGATYVGNNVATWGFTYNLGLDIFVGDPISFGLLWKQSFVNENSVNEFRGLIRYHLKRFDIHGGFIQHKLGDEHFPSAAFGVGYRF